MAQFANKIRSGVSKPLIIFLVVMIALCLAFIPAIIFLPSTPILQIIGYVLCGLFAVIGLIVLIDHLFDYVYVYGDTITKVIIFSKKSAKIKDISKIVHTEGYYDIFVNAKKFTSLSDRDPATTKMFFQFEKFGIDIGNITKEEKKKKRFDIYR